MARSRWKLSFISKYVWRHAFVHYMNPELWKKQSSTKRVVLRSRNSCIPKFLFNNYVFIHAGRSCLELKLNMHQLGSKFGEFAYTRKMFYYPMRKKQKPRK